MCASVSATEVSAVPRCVLVLGNSLAIWTVFCGRKSAREVRPCMSWVNLLWMNLPA
jgi:hypothetical protein